MPRDDDQYADLDFLLKHVEIGTADKPRRIRLVDLAIERMAEWATATTPTTDTRGGTRSINDEDDQVITRRLARAAIEDLPEARALANDLIRISRRLRTFVPRYTVAIDNARLPGDDTVPGCVSCAREKTEGNRIVISRHFSPISDRPRYRKASLCRWCGDHALATIREKHHLAALDEDQIVAHLKKRINWPPHQAVDIYHRQSERAAGLWLADQERRASTNRR
jgi:hypothetical protein